MSLVSNDNIKNCKISGNEFLENVRLLTFTDWKDEYVFADKYPEYVHDLKIMNPNGLTMAKRWIIVPKCKIAGLLADLKEFMTEGSRVNSIEINRTDNYKTVNEFLKYTSNYDIYNDKDNFSFGKVDQIVIDTLYKIMILHCPNVNSINFEITLEYKS